MNYGMKSGKNKTENLLLTKVAFILDDVLKHPTVTICKQKKQW